MKVIVIGTGIMATGIVAGLIAQRIPVVMLGRDAQRCAGAVQNATRIAAGLKGAKSGAALVDSGLIASWSAWEGVDIVIENLAEDLALKQALFRDLDARVPAHIPLGSNSSSYGISKIAAGLPTRSRMFGTHYFMPAEIVPLVEVVLGADSDPVLGQQVCELFAAMKKKPVLVKKDIAGFLANRMQHALIREALALIDAGVATWTWQCAAASVFVFSRQAPSCRRRSPAGTRRCAPGPKSTRRFPIRRPCPPASRTMSRRARPA
ncbi:MAG: 3-hydroxyacyl-CoA dehydrogenase NAD-binding domain-containing protein [Proteobacteria bacterium]|nr:3-hydroxyacyl-CoA dehydrogenase NAD-binding domain-containing protein [Pseudomonadota bacterium]